jgi:hypothetical protein
MTYEIITDERHGEIVKKTNENGDVFWIPIDPANSDYQEYLKSLEESSN